MIDFLPDDNLNSDKNNRDKNHRPDGETDHHGSQDYDDSYDARKERIDRIMDDYRQQQMEQYAETYYPSSEETEFAREFERRIEQFEDAISGGGAVTVRQCLGYPAFLPASEFDYPDGLEAEINRILDLYESRNMCVDFLYEVDLYDAYHFLTEELLDEETTSHLLPEGFFSHFIYEEFHPNDIEDIKEWGGEFVAWFLQNEPDFLISCMSDDGIYDHRGRLLSPPQVLEHLAQFHKRNPIIFQIEIERQPPKINLDGDDGYVELAVSWQSPGRPMKGAGAMAPYEFVRTVGRAKLHLARSIYGGWNVTHAIMPGLVPVWPS